ncbi:MAG: hypothetical protein ACPGRX_02310 [Bdellovibrionales bacterium]
MPWSIVIEDSEGKEELALDMAFKFETLLDALEDRNDKFLDQFRLLRYLDPYGSTKFNTIQMDDLMADLKLLQTHEEEPQIEKIIELCRKYQVEPHTFMTFVGD